MIVREEAIQQFRELGTDALGIRIGRAGPGTAAPVTARAAFGVSALPGIAAAAPFLSSPGEITLAGRPAESVTIVGAPAALADLDKLRVASGRRISDLDRRRYFCVVGAGVAEALREAGFERIVGETLRMEGAVYTVVGVLEHLPRGMRRYSPDRSVFIPISTREARTAQPGDPQRFRPHGAPMRTTSRRYGKSSTISAAWPRAAPSTCEAPSS